MNTEELKDEIAHKRELIKSYKKALQALELQAAKFGIYVPHYIQTEIDDTKRKIKELEQEINQAQTSEHPAKNPRAGAAQAAQSGGNLPVEVDKAELRRQMLKAFDKERLEILCADINTRLERSGSSVRVNPEIVGGHSLEAIILNLIEYLDRRGLLLVLLDAVRGAQPGLI